MSLRLIVRHASGPAGKFALAPGEYVIGRSDECDLRVDHPSISRRHARIVIDSQHCLLEDLGSKNGTFHAEVGISAPTRIAAGDLVRIGDIFCSVEPANRTERGDRNRTLNQSIQWQRQLQPSLGCDSLIRESLRAILDLAAFHRGFALLRSGAGRWRVIATSGLEQHELGTAEFSGSLGSVRECARTGCPVVAHHVDPATWLAGRPSVVAHGIEAVLCLPLRVSERLIGVIYADRTEPGEPIGGIELDILESLAAHASMAIAVARLEETVAQLADQIDDDKLWDAGAFDADGGSFIVEDLVS